MEKSGKRAIFLDRDGVLTEERGYITSVGDMKIFPYAADCIHQIQKKGYYAIVVTNQSGIARGLFTEEQLDEMNTYLKQQTGVDAIYYCLHHVKGTIVKYRKICRCRKPQTGLYETACKEFHINMQGSYMVGDRASDILAGQNIGVKTILLESGYGTARMEEKVEPDYIVSDLRGVVEILR